MAFEDSGLIETDPTNTDALDNLNGILFDRTITQVGLDFYQAFNRLWLAEAGSHNRTLTIRETPTARQGSIIWVEEGSTLLYRLTISLRDRKVTEKAEETLQAIHKAADGYNFNISQF